MTEPIPHDEIKLTLSDAIDTLNHLASKYETIYQNQMTTALDYSEKQNLNKSVKFYEESEITSYKLNYIYWVADLINDSPWFNSKHKLRSGAKT